MAGMGRGLPDNLVDQIIKLEPGQTLVLHFKDSDKAKSVNKKIKYFLQNAVRDGIVSLNLSSSVRSNPSGGAMVMVFCEEPIICEVIESSEEGDPVLRDRFEITL